MVADAPVARVRSDSADVASEVIKQVWAQAGTNAPSAFPPVPPTKDPTRVPAQASEEPTSATSAPSTSPTAAKELPTQPVQPTEVPHAGSPLPARPSPVRERERERERSHGPGHRSVPRGQAPHTQGGNSQFYPGRDMYGYGNNEYNPVPQVPQMGTRMVPTVSSPGITLGMGFGPEYGASPIPVSAPGQAPNQWAADYGMADAYYYYPSQPIMGGGYTMVPTMSGPGSQYPGLGQLNKRESPYPGHPSHLAPVPTVGGIAYSPYPLATPPNQMNQYVQSLPPRQRVGPVNGSMSQSPLMQGYYGAGTGSYYPYASYGTESFGTAQANVPPRKSNPRARGSNRPPNPFAPGGHASTGTGTEHGSTADPSTVTGEGGGASAGQKQKTVRSPASSPGQERHGTDMEVSPSAFATYDPLWP